MKLCKSNKVKAAVCTTLLLLVPGLCAAEHGLYIGGGAGISSMDSSGIDEDDIAYRGYVGWGFNEYLSVEASYTKLGEFDQRVQADLSTGTVTDAEIKGFTAAAVLTIPITDDFEVFGKAGVLAYEADWRQVVDAGTGAVETISTNVFDDNDTDFGFGAGLMYRFNDHVALRGEWERFQAGDFDVDILGLSLQVGFSR